MRPDMAKVIVECYRRGMRIKDPKGYKRRNPVNNEANTQESMRKKWKSNWSGKEFGERLNPLYRYLRSKVGGNWDNIYSELRSQLKADSAVQSHVLDHAKWFVETDVIIINGIPCHKGSRVHGYPLQSDYREVLYVHPLTNKLCLIPIKKKDYKKPEKVIIEKEERKFLLIKEIWYEVTTKDWVGPYGCDDVVYGCISRNDAWQYYKEYVVVKTKRQLNSKEIKRLKLR